MGSYFEEQMLLPKNKTESSPPPPPLLHPWMPLFLSQVLPNVANGPVTKDVAVKMHHLFFPSQKKHCLAATAF